MKAEDFVEKLRFRKYAHQTQSGFWIHENKLPEILKEYAEHQNEKLIAENLELKKLIKEAYNDGFNDSKYDFDIENYIYDTP